MKKMIFSMAAVLAVMSGAGASAQNSKVMNNNKTKALVVCFSATGTTAAVAKSLAGIVGGDFRTIEPVESYTAADLDWHDSRSRSSLEMKDPKSRPAIRKMDIDVSRYDVVFIGYPIWWGLAPRAVNTFIESHDLQSKMVIPFATSGGSGISSSVSALKREYPDLQWKDGRLLNTVDAGSVRSWLGQYGLDLN